MVHENHHRLGCRVVKPHAFTNLLDLWKIPNLQKKEEEIKQLGFASNYKANRSIEQERDWDAMQRNATMQERSSELFTCWGLRWWLQFPERRYLAGPTHLSLHLHRSSRWVSQSRPLFGRLVVQGFQISSPFAFAGTSPPPIPICAIIISSSSSIGRENGNSGNQWNLGNGVLKMMN